MDLGDFSTISLTCLEGAGVGSISILFSVDETGTVCVYHFMMTGFELKDVMDLTA